ncbi:MAG: hypothetical protein O2U62_06200 [Candidatus Bathyarchaeota archaeon]|nr:hypothetical protein [Candidatus Bathyarchaeota archaeon]
MTVEDEDVDVDVDNLHFILLNLIIGFCAATLSKDVDLSKSF